MTDDHFHPESLEEFKGQLTAEGFEPVVSSGPVRWRGPIHPAFSSLSEATTMDIVIRRRLALPAAGTAGGGS